MPSISVARNLGRYGLLWRVCEPSIRIELGFLLRKIYPNYVFSKSLLVTQCHFGKAPGGVLERHTSDSLATDSHNHGKIALLMPHAGNAPIAVDKECSWINRSTRAKCASLSIPLVIT